jgi:predicted component of type VI protein secretion system
LIRLTLIHESLPPNQFELEIADRVILGSDPKVSNLVFDRDSQIAPAHCVIIFTVGRLFIEDLGTEKGTFVNGVAITSRQCLEEQDILKLGNTEMRLTFPA